MIMGRGIVSFRKSGDFKNTEKFMMGISKQLYLRHLEKYAIRGLEALQAATPVDTGLTRDSWGYEISFSNYGVSITWTNSNVVKGVPIAIILYYGHATGTGGYVQGRDYINPTLQPLFDEMAEDIWKEVKSL